MRAYVQDVATIGWQANDALALPAWPLEASFLFGPDQCSLGGSAWQFGCGLCRTLVAATALDLALAMSEAAEVWESVPELRSMPTSWGEAGCGAPTFSRPLWKRDCAMEITLALIQVPFAMESGDLGTMISLVKMMSAYWLAAELLNDARNSSITS